MSEPFSVGDLALLHEIERLRNKNTEQREALKLSVEMINRLTVLKDENTRMRAVFSKCAIALGNGAFLHPEVSIGFLEVFPLEVHAVVRRLTENKDSAP